MSVFWLKLYIRDELFYIACHNTNIGNYQMFRITNNLDYFKESRILIGDQPNSAWGSSLYQ